MPKPGKSPSVGNPPSPSGGMRKGSPPGGSAKPNLGKPVNLGGSPPDFGRNPPPGNSPAPPKILSPAPAPLAPLSVSGAGALVGGILLGFPQQLSSGTVPSRMPSLQLAPNPNVRNRESAPGGIPGVRYRAVGEFILGFPGNSAYGAINDTGITGIAPFTASWAGFQGSATYTLTSADGQTRTATGFWPAIAGRVLLLEALTPAPPLPSAPPAPAPQAPPVFSPFVTPQEFPAPTPTPASPPKKIPASPPDRKIAPPPLPDGLPLPSVNPSPSPALKPGFGNDFQGLELGKRSLGGAVEVSSVPSTENKVGFPLPSGEIVFAPPLSPPLLPPGLPGICDTADPCNGIRQLGNDLFQKADKILDIVERVKELFQGSSSDWGLTQEELVKLECVDGEWENVSTFVDVLTFKGVSLGKSDKFIVSTLNRLLKNEKCQAPSEPREQDAGQYGQGIHLLQLPAWCNVISVSFIEYPLRAGFALPTNGSSGDRRVYGSAFIQFTSVVGAIGQEATLDRPINAVGVPDFPEGVNGFLLRVNPGGVVNVKFFGEV